MKRELEAEAAATAVEPKGTDVEAIYSTSLIEQVIWICHTDCLCIMASSGSERSSEGGCMFFRVRSVFHLPSDRENVKEERERDAHQGGHSSGRFIYKNIPTTPSTRYIRDFFFFFSFAEFLRESSGGFCYDDPHF